MTKCTFDIYAISLNKKLMSEKNEILSHEIDKEIKSKLMKILSTIKKLKEAYELILLKRNLISPTILRVLIML